MASPGGLASGQFFHLFTCGREPDPVVHVGVAVSPYSIGIGVTSRLPFYAH